MTPIPNDSPINFNGHLGMAGPSTNGEKGQSDPSQHGAPDGLTPCLDRLDELDAPSSHREDDGETPSSNGDVDRIVPPTNGVSERDRSGRFGKGNRCGTWSRKAPKGDDHRSTAPSTTGFSGATATVTGRDAQGRFGKNNKISCGNPHARRTALLRSVLVNTVTEEDIRDVVLSLVFRAKTGDVLAAKLLLAYAVGRPDAPANPDRVDLDELALLQESPQSKELIQFRDRVPPETALILGGGLVMAQGMFFAEGFIKDDEKNQMALAKNDPE